MRRNTHYFQKALINIRIMQNRADNKCIVASEAHLLCTYPQLNLHSSEKNTAGVITVNTILLLSLNTDHAQTFTVS